MFAYFTNMNGTNIITYTHDMGRCYSLIGKKMHLFL